MVSLVREHPLRASQQLNNQKQKRLPPCREKVQPPHIACPALVDNKTHARIKPRAKSERERKMLPNLLNSLCIQAAIHFYVRGLSFFLLQSLRHARVVLENKQDFVKSRLWPDELAR